MPTPPISLPRASRWRSVRERLASPRAAPFAALLAVLLTAPSLLAGMAFDDFFQKLRAQGADPFGHHRLDIFDFCWDASDVELGRQSGMFPWFMQDHSRLAFLRPAASVTHYVDYNLWPNHPWLMHLQSLLWYGVAVLLVCILYRRLIGPVWVAGFAAFLYACDEAHALPVAFLANRNAIMALAFGAGALVAHDRWRRDGWRAGAGVGPALFAMALLSAEASIGAFAYLIAYATFLEPAPLRWRKRLVSIAPYAALLVAWQTLARSLGYHIEGSSIYVDPAHEPLRFAVVAPARAIALITAQLWGPPADVWNLVPRAPQIALAALGLVLLSMLMRVLVPLLRRDATTRFFSLGAVLALVPICATFPSDRLLLFVGVGAMGVIARVVGAHVENEDAKPPHSLRWAAKALTAIWLVTHVAIATLAKPAVSVIPYFAREYTERSTDRMTRGTPPREQHVIIINAPNFLLAAYRWSIPRDGVDTAATAHVLSLSMDSVEIERLDASSIVVRTRGPFLSEMSAQLFRSDREPLVLGEKASFHDISAEVSEMGPHGLATGVTFRFAKPLSDARYRFVAWDGEGFVELAMPAEGFTVRAGKDRAAWLLPEGS